MTKFPSRIELSAILDWAFLESNNKRAWKRFLAAMGTYSIDAQIAAAKFVELLEGEEQ